MSRIIWSGDYETGDFRQWHVIGSTAPNLSQMPQYGKPVPYGDGSLLGLVTNPVRQGRYAAKFTVKNLMNGEEPRDCDIPFPSCYTRRTELTGQITHPDVYNAMPYMSERWMSISLFVPEDWDDSGSGWGALVFTVKPRIDGAGAPIMIAVNNGAWQIHHSWSGVENPSWSDVPWYQQMFYHGNYNGQPYPHPDSWADGMRDFPDVSASHAALASLNKGGWTDWIIHVKYDARGAATGGTGFLKFYKREDSGNWIHVLDIRPKVTTRGSQTFDHGIGYNSPPIGTGNGGFGLRAGLYMEKGQVWSLPKNRVIYNDNIKIGDENASLGMMSPDRRAIPGILQLLLFDAP